MERRKFTREFKLEAVRLIRDRGVSYAQASADLNVHTSQLRSWSTRDAQLAEEHTIQAAIVSEDKRRLLLELQFSKTESLDDVFWKWISIDEIPEARVAKLRSDAEHLRRNRVADAKKEQGKIGRNQPCPCGSGRKFKKCCINRD